MSKSDVVGKAKSKVSNKEFHIKLDGKKPFRRTKNFQCHRDEKTKLKLRNNTKKSNGQSTQIK